MASQSDVLQSEALQSEALPSQANSPPPTQRVEGTPPTPPPSQVSPTRLEQVYDDIEEAGAEEWAALRLRVTGSADPGAGAKDRLLAKVKELLPEVPSGTTDTLAAFLKNCTVERREAFFRKWARSVYDTEAVEQEWDLRKKPPAQTLKEFFHKHCQEVYASFLKDNATLNPLQSQRETALKALAPAELASACERLSVGTGLPKDGHLVHACLQGQAIFLFSGQDGKLQVHAMEESESEWNLAGSKLCLIILADSAAGKDNLGGLVRGWLKNLTDENCTATHVVPQGNMTVSGLLKVLRQNHGQAQLLQSELEHFINKKKPNFLQQADCIELLDGSDSFGKATQSDTISCPPNVWVLLPSTKGTYLRELGESESCGRLRFAVLALDSSQVRATAFEEKLVPRSQSQDLVTGCLRWILRLQHKSTPPGQKPHQLPGHRTRQLPKTLQTCACEANKASNHRNTQGKQTGQLMRSAFLGLQGACLQVYKMDLLLLA